MNKICNSNSRLSRHEALKDPKFHAGEVFGSVPMPRKAIREYSFLNKKGYKDDNLLIRRGYVQNTMRVEPGTSGHLTIARQCLG
jgi:hypothetical protein